MCTFLDAPPGVHMLDHGKVNIQSPLSIDESFPGERKFVNLPIGMFASDTSLLGT